MWVSGVTECAPFGEDCRMGLDGGPAYAVVVFLSACCGKSVAVCEDHELWARVELSRHSDGDGKPTGYWCLLCDRVYEKNNWSEIRLIDL